MIKPGIYEHYKGAMYQVLLEATHTETNEKIVVYSGINGSGTVWARPSTMFSESVCVDGVTVPRFQFIRDSGDSKR